MLPRLHHNKLVNKFTISEGTEFTVIMHHLYGSGRPEKMRFYGFAVAVGVITLGACAGGEKNPADTTHVAVDTSASSASTTTNVATGAGGTAAGAATMA